MSLLLLNFVSLKTIAFREWRRVCRIWMQTIIPPIITTSLYFVIFGKIIGPRIGDVEGVSFINYLVPGLVLMAIINNAYANVSSSFFSSKFQRNIEEILVSPTSNWVIIFGYCAGGILRGLVIGLCIFTISLFFTKTDVDSFFITISISILTAILFSLAGLLNGILAKKFDDISIIPTFIITPLIYLGGIFYNVEMLPRIWQKITMFNPIFYMINAMRYGMLKESDVKISTSLIVIFWFIILLYAIILKMLNSSYGVRN